MQVGRLNKRVTVDEPLAGRDDSRAESQQAYHLSSHLINRLFAFVRSISSRACINVGARLPAAYELAGLSAIHQPAAISSPAYRSPEQRFAPLLGRPRARGCLARTLLIISAASPGSSRARRPLSPPAAAAHISSANARARRYERQCAIIVTWPDLRTSPVRLNLETSDPLSRNAPAHSEIDSSRENNREPKDASFLASYVAVSITKYGDYAFTRLTYIF